SPSDWDIFVNLHKQSGWYGHFAYHYGTVNVYEDFATIYEMLLIDPSGLEERASKSEILKKKIEIVSKYLP
ncbi:MAG: hypothetical protein NC898_05740, partial [Candidatus Omnitrophica bacterium]|nr:hypothetical protein [Candidatus Omnitrophota bacterium]